MMPIIRTLFIVVIFCTAQQSLAGIPLFGQNPALPSLAPMLEETMPAVVNISTVGYEAIPEHPLLQDPFFRRFFKIPKQSKQRQTQSLGSGVIVDAEQGIILTNNHVIDGAAEITVTLNDEREFTAELIGADSNTDIAVLKITPDDLTAVDLSDSSKLRVGDFVVAVGNPFELRHTVTLGIVSALGRTGFGQGIENYIQTDASINPGNSGGALIDMYGNLVGINTLILSKSGGSVGIGFAIPANLARNVMQQLLAHGEVQRGNLGIATQDLTAELAQAFGLPNRKGVLLVRVITGSAAAQAGLEPGDIITEVNQHHITDSHALWNSIGLLQAGADVNISYLRDGQQHSTTATLTAPEPNKVSGDSIHPMLQGSILGDSKHDPRQRLHQGAILLTVQPNSNAWNAGLRAGDTILEVNRQAIERLSDLARVLGTLPQNQKLLLLIERNKKAYYVSVE